MHKFSLPTRWARALRAIFDLPSCRQRDATFWTTPTRDIPIDLIVEKAKEQVAPLGLVSIDAGEQCIRANRDGVEVRAWYLVAWSSVPAEWLSEPDWSTVLRTLPDLTRAILALSQQKDADLGDIARKLGVSRRKARRHLREAIERIARQRAGGSDAR